MILVCNGRVITNDENNPFIENGAVLIDENIIKDIGKSQFFGYFQLFYVYQLFF